MPEAGNTTLTERSPSRQGAVVRELSLVWLFPHNGLPPSPLYWEDKGERIIGRDSSCAVRLDGSEVSRRHAAIRREKDVALPLLVDLGSRNGICLLYTSDAADEE